MFHVKTTCTFIKVKDLNDYKLMRMPRIWAFTVKEYTQTKEHLVISVKLIPWNLILFVKENTSKKFFIK